MKLIMVSPKGVVVNEEVDYIIFSGENGQMGILKDHVAVVAPAQFGWIKKVAGQESSYYAVTGGILEFDHNVANVIVQTFAEGQNLEEALTKLDELRAEAAQSNKQKMINFAEMEAELAKNIKEARASSIK